MNAVSLHYLPADKIEAQKLGQSLRLSIYEVSVHKFPDGESRVRVHPIQGTVILYATLNSPNEKLVHLALAASAFRRCGAQRLILVAPYLCYMRQDTEFAPGEAVSQRVIGGYLSACFDRIITVDPHLHRTPDLQMVFPDCKADTLSSTGVIASALSQELESDRLVLVGPDSESEQWVGAIAKSLGVPFFIGDKKRSGDRSVSIHFSGFETMPNVGELHDRRIIIIDDVISSGMTICRCVEALKSAGANTVEVITVHILCSDGDIAMMKAAGVSRIRSTDSVLHPTNAISLTPLLTEALTQEI